MTIDKDVPTKEQIDETPYYGMVHILKHDTQDYYACVLTKGPRDPRSFCPPEVRAHLSCAPRRLGRKGETESLLFSGTLEELKVWWMSNSTVKLL